MQPVLPCLLGAALLACGEAPQGRPVVVSPPEVTPALAGPAAWDRDRPADAGGVRTAPTQGSDPQALAGAVSLSLPSPTQRRALQAVSGWPTIGCDLPEVLSSLTEGAARLPGGSTVLLDPSPLLLRRHDLGGGLTAEQVLAVAGLSDGCWTVAWLERWRVGDVDLEGWRVVLQPELLVDPPEPWDVLDTLRRVHQLDWDPPAVPPRLARRAARWRAAGVLEVAELGAAASDAGLVDAGVGDATMPDAPPAHAVLAARRATPGGWSVPRAVDVAGPRSAPVELLMGPAWLGWCGGLPGELLAASPASSVSGDLRVVRSLPRSLAGVARTLAELPAVDLGEATRQLVAGGLSGTDLTPRGLVVHGRVLLRARCRGHEHLLALVRGRVLEPRGGGSGDGWWLIERARVDGRWVPGQCCDPSREDLAAPRWSPVRPGLRDGLAAARQTLSQLDARASAAVDPRAWRQAFGATPGDLAAAAGWSAER